METQFFSFSAQGIVPTADASEKIIPLPVVSPKTSEFSRITNYVLRTGTILGEFEFQTKEQERVLIGVSDYNRLVFVFNQGDSFEISHCGGRRTRLARYENLLFHCQKDFPITLDFQSHRSFKGTIIVADVKNFEAYLQEGIADILQRNDVFYKSKPDLHITDYIRKINLLPKEFPHNLAVGGFATVAVGTLWSAFLKGEKENVMLRPSLRSWEIKALEEVTDKIRQNPEQNYTVSEISKETGISIPHLQQGFKEMHGHTVANFIREVRLEKAEDLIKNSDLNISEIVYTIGLSSRSYFSRIFKKKFKCSPSDYQRLQFINS
ncbi:MAG TPA: AraC family transcriptional regulator [Flavobacteriaceae bacterium]|nr:AraC family transcriptional regulator [Flavobacteriaceae bacterium]